MSWFSVGVPVLLQLLVPLGLLAAVVKARSASRATFVGMTILAAAYIVAIHRAGLWLVLPWFTPFAYAAALLTVVYFCYLFGFANATLVDGAIGGGANRSTAMAVSDYLLSLE